MVAKVKGIKNLIDKGHNINKRVATLNAELSTIKEKIRQHAKAVDKNELKGTNAKVTVSDSHTTTVDNLKAWTMLGRNITTFKKVITVKLGEIKKHISDQQLKTISSKTTKSKHIVRFYNVDEEIIEDERLPRRMDN